MIKNLFYLLPLFLFAQLWLRNVQGPFIFYWTDLILPLWAGLSFKILNKKKIPLSVFALSLLFLVGEYLKNEGANLVALSTLTLCLLFWIIKFFIYSYGCLKDKNFLKLLAISTLCWTLIALAFPPLPLGFAIWILLAPWLFSLEKLNKKQGATLTFWASIPFNAIMHYWIYNVMKVGPALVISIGLFLLISYLSLYNVLGAWLYQSLKEKKKVWVFPLAWIGIEVIRTKGEISFPWGHLAYTTGLSDQMIQASAWIGVFGISALIIIANQLFLKAYLNKNKRFLALALIIPLSLWAIGFGVLSKPIKSEKFAKIALVQPNIEQTNKWNRKYYYDVLDRTWALVEGFSQKDSLDLVVLPETSIPNFAQRVPQVLRQYQLKAQEENFEFFLGILDTDKNGPPPKGVNYFNTGRWIRSTLEKDSVYNKIFLVPFSERLPFDKILPIINFLDFGEGDFSPGDHIPLYKTNGFSWTPNICYESIYPFFIRDQVKMGSELIVNITNDGWFGPSTEPYQHLNLVKFRAAENGIPIARNTNTGVTAFINQYGIIESQTPIMMDTVLTAKIGLKNRTTFYSIWGNFIEFAIFSVFLIICLLNLIPISKALYIFKARNTKGKT